MTEDDVVNIIYEFVSNQEFPKTCSSCGRVYSTLKEYLQVTTPVGEPVSYDAELENWEPDNPIGTMSLANCSCKGTMAISSTNMPVKTLIQLMLWLKVEALKRKLQPSELLNLIRQKVDKKALRS